MIERIKLKTLLYADDIILLSSSEQGLQRSLNVLNEFSNDWKLEVNHEKSKVIVFNSNGKLLINKFKFQDKVLETIKSYCYIGITIKYTRGIVGSSHLLMQKDRKSFSK